MRLQPAHLYEAAAHHEEGHQIGQHKVGQIVAESGFLVKVFLKTRPKPAFGRQGLDWIVGPEYSTHTEKPTWNHEKP